MEFRLVSLLLVCCLGIARGTPPGYSYSAGLTRGSVFPGGAYSAGLTRGSVFPGGAYSAGLTGGSVLQGGAYSAGLPGGAVLQGGAYSAGLPGGAVFPVAGGGAGPYTGITHGGSLPGGYVLPGAGAAGLNAYSSGSLYTTGMPGSAFPTGGAGHVGNVVNFGGVSVGSGWPYTYSGGNFGAGRVGNVINLGGQGYAPALTAGSYGTGLSYANRYTGSLGAYRPVGLGSYGMVPQSVYGASGYSQIPSGLAGFPLGLAGTGSYGRVGSSNYGGPTFGTSGNAFGGAANARASGGSTAVAYGGTAGSGSGVGNTYYTGFGTGQTSGIARFGYGGDSFYGGGGGSLSGGSGYSGVSQVVGVQAAGMQCGQFRGSRCPYGTSMRGNCGGKKKKCKICCQQVLQRICKTKGKKGPRYYQC